MANKQAYYMVYGGEMSDVAAREFKDNDAIDIVGIFNDYEEAFAAWRGAAQKSVDNAQVRYFIVQIDDIQKVSQDPGAS